MPVAAEVNRRPAPHGQARNAEDLIAVADAAQVFTPGGFPGVANQIRPGNVVVMAKLAATQAGKVGLRAIRAGAVYTEAILMVDPAHGEAGVQRVPRGAFIGMHRGALGDAQPDRRHGVSLGRKTCATVRPPRSRIATTTWRLPD